MTTDKTIRILGISGSLRSKSYNTAALHAAKKLLPAGSTLEIADIGELPLYNDDVREKGYPLPVEQFRSKIAAADALLIATPEYNYSVSGVLKNAIDWASRPPNHPFAGKPIAILSASQGPLGGSRAQYHLRQMFIFLDALILNKPEVFIGLAQTKFDEQGNLTDPKTGEFIQALLVALVNWTKRLHP